MPTKPTSSIKTTQPTIMSSYMLPKHANRRGKVFGGHLLSLIDIAAAVCAMRYSGIFVVTGKVETTFLKPVDVGNLVTLTAEILSVGTSSMKVSIIVVAEDLPKPQQTRIAEATVTMVAVDDKGKSSPLQKRFS